MIEACQADEVLADSARGELIDTEIEIRSGRGRELRRGDRAAARAPPRCCSGSPARMGVSLAAMGTHPWADYLDQRIIDTPHYNRLREELAWVARRNQTWSLHVHVGVRGADRASPSATTCAACCRSLLAVSANSPFLDGVDTGLASVRTQIFTRTFPRCGIHEPFGDWASYAELRRAARADRLDRRVDPAVVERAPASQLRHRRGADLRRAERRRGVVAARRADARLRRPGGARLRRRRAAGAAGRPRDRGEPLAGDPLRARRAHDRLRRGRGDRGRRRPSSACSHGRRRRARRSASTPSRAGRTAPSAPARRSPRAAPSPRSTATRSPRPPAPTRPTPSTRRAARG